MNGYEIDVSHEERFRALEERVRMIESMTGLSKPRMVLHRHTENGEPHRHLGEHLAEEKSDSGYEELTEDPSAE